MLNFSHITTRGGDSGKSTLYGGDRRYKSDSIFSILGDIDELVSYLGLCRYSATKNKRSSLAEEIFTIQKNLQNLSSLIATPPLKINTSLPLRMKETEWETHIKHLVDQLEKTQQVYMQNISVNNFIIPGDCELSAQLDIARTICRRAERELVSYIQALALESYRLAQNYINRLSDSLFVFARYVEQNSPPKDSDKPDG